MLTPAVATGILQLPLEVHGPRAANSTRTIRGGWRAMAMLTAYDPFAATNSAFRLLDQLSGRMGTARPPSGVPMGASKGGDHLAPHLGLPGVHPGSIDLANEGQTLTVTAERSV